MVTDILFRVTMYVLQHSTLWQSRLIPTIHMYMRHESADKYRMDLLHMEQLAISSMQRTDQ